MSHKDDVINATHGIARAVGTIAANVGACEITLKHYTKDDEHFAQYINKDITRRLSRIAGALDVIRDNETRIINGVIDMAYGGDEND